MADRSEAPAEQDASSTDGRPVGVARYPRHEHLVSFYESEEFLLASLVEFLEPALGADEAAVVIAGPVVRRRLADRLATSGVDLSGLSRDNRLVLLDADEMLAEFMHDGVPDRERFAAVIGDVVERATAGHRHVRVFGEMVAVLWDQGNVGGALAVEGLWNGLAEDEPFTLLCGYPISGFADDASTAAFHRICDMHSIVIPAEIYASHDAGSQGRALATLQQRLLAADTARDESYDSHRQLQARLDDLDEAGRLREQFVATVVHDLQTPTTLVSTALGLLRQTLTERSQDVEQLLAMALEGTERIERLAADVLAAAQIHADAFTYRVREVDLGEVVEQAVRGVQVSTGRTIEYLQQQDRARATADEDRQRQILDNLLWNAVKFSHEDSPVRVALSGSADWLRVSVQDEGVGIAEEDLAALFHPFSRLHVGDVAGTGLGLSITKALVEGQGGSIRVESQPGVGSVFSYTVPAAR